MRARVDQTARIRALDELYGTSPEQFTERRDALAKALKAAGDLEGAADVRGRRRPTKVAFLLNQLARQAPDEIAALVDLGRELARAQRRALRGQAGAGELRDAIARQREAVAALVRRATDVGRAIDVDAAPLLDEVASTLRTAMTDPAAGAELEEGRLAKAPEVAIGLPSGALAEESPASPRPPTTTTEATRERGREKAARGREKEARDRAERERERERVERERVARDRAEAHARDLAARAAELRAAAEAAEGEARRARTAAEAAAREAEKRLRAAEDAERRARDAAHAGPPSRPVVSKRPAPPGPARAARAHLRAEPTRRRARPSARSRGARARHA